MPRQNPILPDNERFAAARSDLLIENLALRQQLHEAFAYDAVARRLVFDNDKKYRTDVLAVIVLNERHLYRLLSEFVAYDHDDRTHLGLVKGTPSMRAAISKPNGSAEIVGHPRIGGLHQRCEWRQAARPPVPPSECSRLQRAGSRVGIVHEQTIRKPSPI